MKKTKGAFKTQPSKEILEAISFSSERGKTSIDKQSSYISNSKNAIDELIGDSIQRSFTHPITGSTVSVPGNFLKLSYNSLESTTKVAGQNPRIWLSNELQNSPLTEQIRAEGIRHNCHGVRYKGDSTIYIANGGTRRGIALHLLSEGVEGEYPLEVFDIDEENDWILDILIDDSDINKKFSTYENTTRLLRTYNLNPNVDLKSLTTSFLNRTGITAPNKWVRTILISSILKHHFDAGVKKAFSNKDDISERVLSSLIEFITKQEMKSLDITIRIPAPPESKAKFASEIRKDLKDYLESLVDEDRLTELLVIMERPFSKPKTEIPKALKQYLKPDDDLKITSANGSRQNGYVSSSNAVGIELLFDRSDFDKEEMILVKNVLKKRKKEIETLVEEIKLEVKNKTGK